MADEVTVNNAAMGADGSATPHGPVRAPNAAVAGLEQQLAALFATARTVVRDRALSVHPELSPSGYNVLSILVRSGPQHAGALATALFVDKSVMSRLIRQLTDLGLAERRADPADGRAFYIAATAGAIAKVDTIRDDYRQSLHRFLDDWDPADIRLLTDLLGKLTRVAAGPER